MKMNRIAIFFCVAAALVTFGVQPSFAETKVGEGDVVECHKETSISVKPDMADVQETVTQEPQTTQKAEEAK